MKISINQINYKYQTSSSANPQYSLNPSIIQNGADLSKLPHYRPAFKGIESEMGAGIEKGFELGQKVLKSFVEEFPNLQSSTLVELRIHELLQKGGDRELLAKLNDEFLNIHTPRAHEAIAKISGRLYSEWAVAKKTREVMKETNYANCHQRADVILYELQKLGETPHNILMEIKSKATNKRLFDHVTTVIGLKEGNNPLGRVDFDDAQMCSEAVAVDGFFNKVLKSGEISDYYKEKFLFNPEEHIIQFSCADRVFPEGL